MLCVRAVVFDLDDTLVLERDYVRSGYAHVARWLAPRLSVEAESVERELWTIFDSPHRARAYDRLLEMHGVRDARLVEECVDSYRQHAPDIALSASASEILDWCLEHGPVGVVTDGPSAMQEGKVAALGLAERGIEIVISNEISGRRSWKPSSIGIREVCRRMGVPPRHGVYVGDNPHKDFLAARAAGLGSIRYRTTGQLHAAVTPDPGAEPDVEIHDLTELRDVLCFDCEPEEQFDGRPDDDRR